MSLHNGLASAIFIVTKAYINGFEVQGVSLFNRDKINLIKKDGSSTDQITATVAGSDLIVIQGSDHIVEPGDLVTRRLSNGGEETYQVIDPKYYESTPGQSGPHYQLKVKKLGLPDANRAVQHVIQNITYNVSGNNARVNVGSVDNSTNTVHPSNDVEAQIEALRKEISELKLPAGQQADANEVLDEVKEQLATGKPKRSVVLALLNSLPKVATIAVAVAKISAIFA